uniref:DNA topoisomerase (ATP-hydrolyzing) n=1 Tax=Odontella aurita TaxID=265563 RepID=A0A7S4HJY7_9STRA|mmetsp:Transcript_11081/g.32864  ORF Transcript_11081/g.32864 Transcript_11081/m.32864 type:complete len:477 (+) Transcript_11081:259-1689(+)|eukprot:CAMPEP_0113559188 /NCGR_PEP_ID=MMETSP0015_2-20120614/18755_1 /TAXON_ID=2838 /ORGANISM="Odontella" /LENGTH=476 /DNA_ID=CAMNT_0000460791 /DNA_START=184 /DNA_END=1614 /DNA_ORIENTATION=+ /assembly_acc=CAM_ASM_000160
MPPKKKLKKRKSAGSTARASLKVDDAVDSGEAPRMKKKEVKIASDADAVLRKCRALRDSMRRKASTNSDDSGDDSYGEEGDDEAAKPSAAAVGKVVAGGNRKRRVADLKSLTSVDSSAIVEVDDMSSLEVVEGIEGIAVKIATQVLAKRGFALEIPSRAASNQIYVPELDRIVLGNKKGTRSFLNVKESRKTAITARVLQLLHSVLMKRIHITKRDLFYTDVKLFVDQQESDVVLDDVACMVGCTRSNLHVVASDKGLVVGRINFYEDGDFIDCTRMGVGGKAIPPYIDKIESIKSDAEFVLLVEKEAAYMRLAEDRFYHRYPCIVITAKGQPDVATRMFLSRLTSELQIPVLGLVDSDPYGLKILSVYMSGSKNMSYDSASLTTPDIKWLGLRPSDLDKYDLPEQCRLDMTENDIKTGKELLKEEFIMKNPKWMKELQLMVKTKKKAEIQALSSFGFQYITEEYLPRKIKEGDWL